MQIADFHHEPGKHWETGNLRSLLTHQGVVAPHTGRPFTEAMLLGVGGGLDGGYFLCGGSIGRILGLVGRHFQFSTRAEFAETVAGRLGAKAVVKEAGGTKAALANLTGPLAEGRPVIVNVAQGMLPWHHLPARYTRCFMYSTLVVGFDPEADVATVSDRGATPMTLSAKSLTAARAGICTHRSRTVTIDPPAGAIDLAPAIRAGLRDSWQGMLRPKFGSLGLSGLEKWEGFFANPRHKDGWPKAVVAAGRLHENLMWLYYWVESCGTGGGFFRQMYADFLDEAAPLIAEGG